ncbi:MAG: hypothetical protein RJA49_3149 [Actinomycetota bacterium]
MSLRRGSALAVAVFAALLAACGGTERPSTGTLSAGTRQTLAIVFLGATGAGRPAGHVGHHFGAAPDHRLAEDQQAIFDAQLSAARGAAPRFSTIQKAAALGYVRASVPSPGIGTHWVLWSQIAKPFDPTHPAMLLFDEKRHPAVLVGYSYALQSPTLPEGFAGDNDQWHQHAGLCVDPISGWMIREGAASPDACSGTYIAGGDFWMLHAWVVPGWDNRQGRFAVFNPKLCPPAAGTPDIMRCPT